MSRLAMVELAHRQADTLLLIQRLRWMADRLEEMMRRGR